jgi:hypothetical protein
MSPCHNYGRRTVIPKDADFIFLHDSHPDSNKLSWTQVAPKCLEETLYDFDKLRVFIEGTSSVGAMRTEEESARIRAMQRWIEGRKPVLAPRCLRRSSAWFEVAAFAQDRATSQTRNVRV